MEISLSRHWPHIACVFAAAAVAGPSVGFDFVLFDDDYLVYRNRTVQELSNLPSFFDPATHRTDMGPEYLPITTTSFALDHAIFGLEPAGFHLTNVILYVSGCWLLLAVLLNVFDDGRAALVGALIFVVHPLHTESFAWVSERKTLLNFVFVLLSLYGYMRFREQQRYGWLTASVVAFVLAFMSKYTAASLPLAFVAYDLTLGRRFVRGVPVRALPVVPFFAVSAVMTWIAMEVASRYQILKPAGDHLKAQLLNDPVIILHYLRLLILPVGQCAYYLWPLAPHLSATAVFGYAVTAFLVIGCWRLRRRAPELGFAGAWFLILLLPVLNFVPKGLWVAERYLFLPSVALAFAAAASWSWLDRRSNTKPRRRALVVSAGAVVCLLAVACLERSFVWRDSVSLWTSTLAHPLGNPVAYDQLGLHYLTRERRPGKAERVFAAGIRDMERRGTPASGLALRLRFHRILCYLAVGAESEAREQWSELERLCTRRSDPSVVAEYAAWRADLARLAPSVVRDLSEPDRPGDP